LSGELFPEGRFHGQKAGKMSRRKMREGLKAYAFMAPALVILILFTIIPIIGSLVLMFF